MGKLIVDIETAALPNAADYLDAVSVPANYTRQDTIDAHIETKRAEQLGKAALDPDLCQVVAIGVEQEGGHSLAMTLDDFPSGKREIGLLEWFWEVPAKRGIHVGDEPHFVGYNLVGFDLPVLIRRSLYLGVEAPQLRLGKYSNQHPDCTDLMLILSNYGAFRYHGLRFYARRFGLPLPEDAIDGSGIAQAVAEGNWSAVENHVRADVQLTAALAERMGLFQASVSFPPSGGEGSLVGSSSPSVSPALLVESEPLAPQSLETVGQSGQ